MVGAGSFGTAVAVLLMRAGLRTALLCRTAEQAEELARSRHNERYLPGVELPRDLRVRALGGARTSSPAPTWCSWRCPRRRSPTRSPS